MFIVRLKKFQTTPPLFGLSSFLYESFRDCGCGKAMSFDDSLKADVYDRIRALADDTRAAYPLAMKVFGQDGWDDPQMDEYNVLDPRR